MVDIAVGDVVQLKSGGLLMTVSAIWSDGFHCVAFLPGTAELQRYSFPPEVLRKVETPERATL